MKTLRFLVVLSVALFAFLLRAGVAQERPGEAAPAKPPGPTAAADGKAGHRIALASLSTEQENAFALSLFRQLSAKTEGGELGNAMLCPGGVTRLLRALNAGGVGSSRVDLQACKLEYSIVSPK